MTEIIYDFDDIARRVKNPNYDPYAPCAPKQSDAQQQCEPAQSVFQCACCGGIPDLAAHPPMCDDCYAKALVQRKWPPDLTPPPPGGLADQAPKQPWWYLYRP